MLKALRNKKTAKKIWIVLAIIIVPPFVLWGLGGALKSQKEAVYAGKIFGKNVSILDYRDALEAVKNQAIMQFGDDFFKIQKNLNLEAQAWERLILLQEAKKRKIKVTDRQVIELLQNYPFFQRKGKFDNALYNETLRYVFRVQPRAFEEQTRQNLILSKLYAEVTQNLKLGEEEIKKEYRKLNEEISLYYIAAVPDDFQKELAPTEDQIQEYFRKNSLEFKQPPTFNLEYICLDAEDKVRSAIPRLNKEDFAKLAGELGSEVKETGFFSQNDPVPGIGWSPEILNLIAKLKIGQFAVPIQMDKNYYLLRLKEKKDAYIPDFTKIKNKARELWLKEESTKIAKEKIAECLRKIEELVKIPKQIALADIAKTYALKSDSTKLFKYNSYIEGIGASDILWLAAQNLKEDEFSNVVEMSSGFYIIKIKERTPIDEKKFSAEKADFTQRLLAQKKQEYFTQFLAELKRKAQMF